MKASTELLLRVQAILNEFGSAGDPLDELSRRILLHVSNAQRNGQDLKVSDISFNEQYGSPPTVMTRLKKLIAAGWLKSSLSPDDGRVQLISLTSKSERTIKTTASKIRRAATS